MCAMVTCGGGVQVLPERDGSGGGDGVAEANDDDNGGGNSFRGLHYVHMGWCEVQMRGGESVYAFVSIGRAITDP